MAEPLNAEMIIPTQQSSSSISVTSTSSSVPSEPDADTIKMFVGQIPRSWDENECRKLFEEHGPVHQLNILRDKSNQTSKGCCFVTYYHRKDAIAAQNALHDIVVLPGMHHAVQMKPADSENRNERKLFVGMLSKRTSECEVRSMFDSFGMIEDCTILKGPDGISRGCAFVTYVNRNCAQQAIKQMHHSRTMEGSLKPLVVKFADTQKDKESKKPVMNNASTLLQQYTQAPQVGSNVLTNLTSLLLQASSQPQVLSLLGNVLTGLGGQTQQQAPSAVPAPVSPSGLSASGQIAAAAAAAAVAAQTQPAALKVDRETGPNGNAAALLSGLGTYNTSPAAGLTATAAALHQGTQSPRLLDFLSVPVTAAHTGMPTFDANSLSFLPASTIAAASQAKGPEGANLFIYHLPQEFKDQDLLTTFGNFGTILSAKVFIDKHTNLSKCFGFVSFENPLDAQRAIQAMNGLQIGNKRLKVQLKRMGVKPY